MIVLLLITLKILASPTAFENDSGIVVSDSGRLVHLRVPPELKNADRYSIALTLPEEKPGGGGNGSGSRGGDAGSSPRKPSEVPMDELSIEQLMIRAKRSYRKKNYDEALTYLQQAEKIDSKNFRVKKMMGSVFYIMGWKEYAAKFYKQSLDLEPNQPRIQSALKKLENQGGVQ